MLIAGNITPIDVISHLPVLCEESSIPYVYVPRKEDLGLCLFDWFGFGWFELV